MWNDITTIESPLVEFVRDRKNNKVGVLLSGIYNDKVVVGWSLCSKLDEFDRYQGFFIAEGRAMSNDRMDKYIPYFDDGCVFGLDEIIPSSIFWQLVLFVGRISRYYKDADYSSVVEYLYNTYKDNFIKD